MLIPRAPASLRCLVAITLGLFACKGSAGDPCKGPNECGSGLFCPKDRCVTKEKVQDECSASRLCATVGACSAAPDGSFCRVGSDADCQQSIGCQNQGACSTEQWTCVAKQDADCSASHECETLGHCGVRGAQCGATNAGCQKTALCQSSGRCSAKPDGECGALTDKDCQGPLALTIAGKHHARDGICVATSEDCHGTLQCVQRGACTPFDGSCQTESDIDCIFSEGCASNRLCASRGASCSEVGKDCKDTPACTHHGRCAGGSGVCVATDDEHCKDAEICKGQGKCSFVHKADGTGGECAKDCSDSQLCLIGGLCSLVGNGCAVTSDADCAKSLGCKENQLCTADNGRCVHGPDGCRKTADCAAIGLCSPQPKSPETECMAASDDDCAKSAACAIQGLCAAKEGKCVANDAGCRAAPGCKNAGRCTAVKDTCAAATPADCGPSDLCRGGKCHIDNGSCVAD